MLSLVCGMSFRGCGCNFAEQLRGYMAGVLLVPVLDAVTQEGVRSAAWGHRSCREDDLAIGIPFALAGMDEVRCNWACAYEMASAATEAAKATSGHAHCSDGRCDLVFYHLCDFFCEAGDDGVQGVKLVGGWIESCNGCRRVWQRWMRSQGCGCGAHQYKVGGFANVREWVRIIGKVINEFLLESLSDACLQCWLQPSEEGS